MGNKLLEKAITNLERAHPHHERAPHTLNGHSLFIEGHSHILKRALPHSHRKSHILTGHSHILTGHSHILRGHSHIQKGH